MPVKKHIRLILILMSLCIAGIIGLQLFWNYQNYQSTIKNFDHDINEALNKAVDRETDQRREQLINQMKGWLADTSLITITADHKNRDSATVFHIKDTHPKFLEDKKRQISFGFEDFKEKLFRINDKVKNYLINRFCGDMVKRDLKEGVVYHYTQTLGDSLEKAFRNSHVNLLSLHKLFREELDRKNINGVFVLDPGKQAKLFLTKPVNTDFRKPYLKQMVVAGFESPNAYFFKVMKGVIVTSLLLIAITISCFSYTVRTLLSQERLSKLKDDFINNMTHELNTPLASIRITAESLKNFSHSPKQQREYLDIISYQAEKLTDMTGQILLSRRLTATTTGNVELGELINRAITELKPKIEQQQAVINYQADNVAVKGDAGGLINTFINLIDNALKYTLGPAKIDIAISAANGFAEIIVADNGIGIPKEYQTKVFEQFFRVPQGNQHNVKGYGLGLSYVSQVVTIHKGSVSVSDNATGGSIFTVKLPL